MNNSSILELQTWLVYQRVAIDCAGCLCKYIQIICYGFANSYCMYIYYDVVLFMLHVCACDHVSARSLVRSYCVCTLLSIFHARAATQCLAAAYCAGSHAYTSNARAVRPAHHVSYPRRAHCRNVVINTSHNVPPPPPPGRQSRVRTDA